MKSCEEAVLLHMLVRHHSLAEMFLTKPIVFPASGQDPNFARPGEPSLVWAILLSNGLFIPLVAIVIALRIFTKFSMTKQVFLDDCKCHGGGKS